MPLKRQQVYPVLAFPGSDVYIQSCFVTCNKQSELPAKVLGFLSKMKLIFPNALQPLISMSLTGSG